MKSLGNDKDFQLGRWRARAMVAEARLRKGEVGISKQKRAMSTRPVIWKFVLQPWSIFLDLPKGAEILSVGAQGDDVVAWARCDPGAPKVSRLLAAHPTGTGLLPAFEDADFVGTAQMDDGLVFHVFDGGERSK